MGDKISLIRLPLLLILIFYLGKLIGGALGMPYEAGAQVFGMVPLTIHLCLIWGALSRPVYGLSVGNAVIACVLIALFAQILIFGTTVLSYLIGWDTHFSNPVAILRAARDVPFGEAVIQRAIGLVVNCVLAAVAGLIGRALGGFIAAPAK